MFVPQIIHFDSLPSTNGEAIERAKAGAREGVCVVAREQTAGRGRLHRSWISPKDAGLYISLVLRAQFEQKRWPLLTLMSAVVVHDVLTETYDLDVDIKWPNDILAEGRKLSGILAETVETEQGRAVVIGIGINLTTDCVPQELAGIATSIETISGKKPDPKILLDALVERFAGWYERLDRSSGANEIISEWSTRSSFAEGKQVEVTEVAEAFTGTTRGLEPDGALRVETNSGEIRIVHAGDVSSLRMVKSQRSKT
jgi:BirA family biotin operon repressor/biotin-[acetyl-CoA-carboxylase] ligase